MKDGAHAVGVGVGVGERGMCGCLSDYLNTHKQLLNIYMHTREGFGLHRDV